MASEGAVPTDGLSCVTSLEPVSVGPEDHKFEKQQNLDMWS